MTTLRKTGIALAMAGLAACGGGGTGDAGPAAAVAPATPAASASAPERRAPAVASAARDVSSIEACKLVTPQDVAGIVGGVLLNEPPAGFPNCAYVLDVNGTTESYRLAYSAPEVYEALLDSQAPGEKGERLDAAWDEAWIQPRDGGGYSVIVLKRGERAVEATGDRRDPAVEIAKLAVSRAD